MTLPNNILQNVRTYNMADLAYLQNNNCFIATANTKYRDFQKSAPANLGDTITFDKPSRFVANDGLTVNFQGVEQRVETLTVDRAKIHTSPYRRSARPLPGHHTPSSHAP